MLQKAGLITYRYGKLTILNPEGLLEGCCDCYSIMEAQFEKIFNQQWLQIAESGPSAEIDSTER